MSAPLETIRDYVRWGASRFAAAELFFGHGTDSAWDDAVSLVLHALHLSPGDAETHADLGACRITEPEAQVICELFRRRIDERLPAPYLTGRAWFAGVEFEVNESVLIPRSPIAELIEQGFSPWLPDGRRARLLDLCTGSGCIAIAAALYLPEARVDAVDISPAALAVAETNVQRHDVQDRVRLVEGDLLRAIGDMRYDLIVTNPPYVGEAELDQMPEEYRREPSLALASGRDGLDLPLQILSKAARHLTEQGVLVLEVGNSEQALVDALPQVPFLWLEFERGGHGVCVLERQQLVDHHEAFERALTTRN